MPWAPYKRINWEWCGCGLSYYNANTGKNTQIPLTQVDVNVEIVGDFFAEVIIQQHFINANQGFLMNFPRGKKKNVSYTFPLEESAAVCGFKATLGGGVVIEGVSKEKREARREFNQAVRQGKKAALLDQKQQDTFLCEIGNLDAGETCVVELRYVTELPVENGAVKLVIPTVIAPRYKMQKRTPWWSYESYPVVRYRWGGGYPWGHKWRDPTHDVSSNGAYPLSISVNAEFSSKVLSVNSPTHKIYTHKNDGANKGQVKVELVGPKLLSPNISCRQCRNNFILGEQYVCAVCPGYTVCEGCLEGHQHDHPLVLKEEKIDVSGQEEHKFIQCDECQIFPLRGPRYKCVTCLDFDFCENCYKTKKAKHGHAFQRVFANSLDAPIPQYVKSQIAKCTKGHELRYFDRAPAYNYQTGFFCDECNINLLCEYGLHHCQTCDYDLCQKCYTKKSPFLKVEPLASSDIVFLFKQEFPYKTRSLVGYSPKHKSTALQVTFCRERQSETADLPCELIFIADTSGSMAGMAMENLKKTMQLFLRSLPTNCRFNLIEFDSRYRRLYLASKQLSKQTLEDATHYVDGWQASGGTEILDPIKWVLRQPPISGCPRQVFLLTDGGVSNANKVVRTVYTHASSTRVFTFGIGSSASRFLCKGVARAGNGTCEFVDSNEVADKVMRTMTRALQPPYFGAKIDWSPFDARLKQGYFQCPELLPPMYPGERYFVYAIQKVDDETKDPNVSKFDDECLMGEFECEDFRVKVADNMTITLSNGKSAALKKIDVSDDTKMWLLDDGYFLDEQNSTDETILWMLRYQYYSKGWNRTVTWKRIGKSKKRIAFEHSLMPKFDDFHLPIDGKVPSVVEQEGQSTAEMVKVSLEGLHTGDILHCLAARAKIREMEKQTQTDDVKKAIIALGTTYNLASQYTSFVAVQKTTKPKEQTSSSSSKMEREGTASSREGEMTIEVVENTGEEGQSGGPFGSSLTFHGRLASSVSSLGASSVACFGAGGGFGSFGAGGGYGASTQSGRGRGRGRGSGRSGRGGLGATTFSRSRSRSRSRSPERSRRCRSRSRDRDRRSKAVKSKKRLRTSLKSSPDFDTIIRLQQFDGSWNLSDELTSMAGLLAQTLKASGLFQGVSDAVFATCIALVMLKKYFGAQKNSWAMLEVKGKRFIATELGKVGKSDLLDKMLQC